MLALAACTTPTVASPVVSPSAALAGSSSPTATAQPSPTPTASVAASPSQSFVLPTPVESPFAPDLEARLPAELRGIPLIRVSTPLSNFAGGGDMCIVLCSHEPGRLADAAGMDLDELAFAMAIPPDGADLAVQIVAIRFPGLATDRLVPTRLKAGGHSGPPENDPPPRVTAFEAGGEPVSYVEWMWWFENAGQAEYLYGRDDILFIINGLPPTGQALPGDVTLAVEAIAAR